MAQEARLACVSNCGNRSFWGDSSPKHIAFRRSNNYGWSWTPTQWLVQSDGTNDNLNLGSAVVDKRAGAVILQWGGCVHCSCTGSVPKPAPGECDEQSKGNVKQIRSTDSGKSWSEVRDISSQVLQRHPIFKLGEGSGVQLPSGDLIVCGRFSNLGKEGCGGIRSPARSVAADGSGGNCGSGCIASTDGGIHWTRRAGVPATAALGGPNECEPSLLKNGSILLNMRDGAARLLALSNDEAMSFVNVHTALDLSPVADCQGSMQSMSDGQLIFTAPAGSAKRRNLSMAVSTDQGSSWEYTQVVHGGPSAYSSVAPRWGGPGSGGCAALMFEGGEDANSSTYQHIYFTNVCAA